MHLDIQWRMYIYAKLYVIYDNFLSTLSPTRPPFTSQLPFVCSSLQPRRNKYELAKPGRNPSCSSSSCPTIIAIAIIFLLFYRCFNWGKDWSTKLLQLLIQDKTRKPPCLSWIQNLPCLLWWEIGNFWAMAVCSSPSFATHRSKR